MLVNSYNLPQISAKILGGGVKPAVFLAACLKPRPLPVYCTSRTGENKNSSCGTLGVF